MSCNSPLKILNLALVLEGEKFSDLRVLVTDNEGKEIAPLGRPDDDVPMNVSTVSKPTRMRVLRTSTSWKKVRIKMDSQVSCVRVEFNDNTGEPTGRTRAC